MNKLILFFFFCMGHIYMLTAETPLRVQVRPQGQDSSLSRQLSDVEEVALSRGEAFFENGSESLDHSARNRQRVAFLFATEEGFVARRPGSSNDRRLEQAVVAWGDPEQQEDNAQSERSAVTVDQFREQRAFHDSRLATGSKHDKEKCCSPCSYAGGFMSGIVGSVLVFVILHANDVLKCAHK